MSAKVAILALVFSAVFSGTVSAQIFNLPDGQHGLAVEQQGNEPSSAPSSASMTDGKVKEEERNAHIQRYEQLYPPLKMDTTELHNEEQRVQELLNRTSEAAQLREERDTCLQKNEDMQVEDLLHRAGEATLIAELKSVQANSATELKKVQGENIELRAESGTRKEKWYDIADFVVSGAISKLRTLDTLITEPVIRQSVREYLAWSGNSTVITRDTVHIAQKNAMSGWVGELWNMLPEKYQHELKTAARGIARHQLSNPEVLKRKYGLAKNILINEIAKADKGAEVIQNLQLLLNHFQGKYPLSESSANHYYHEFVERRRHEGGDDLVAAWTWCIEDLINSL